MPEISLQAIEALFHEAAALAPADRDALLDDVAVEQPDLAARVRALLVQHDRDATLRRPPSALSGDGAHADERNDGPDVGDRVGRYVLRARLGEGGFGVVFRAEQQAPVVREVALKLIKLGMDTKEVVARFEAERQALALMDHPGIAKVLDGGATEAGRPYFVMELVRGTAITDYCDQHQLGTEARLALFAEVCRAVQHAHQKGVIHRDLKPSNVLVTRHDGRPVPKVIDFGVAKAIHARLTERTLQTQFQRFIGTPAYMSPEQAESSSLDLDTRTDIYSLGVLLYELLTGATPFDAEALWRAGLAEMQRVLRDEQPEKPSSRVSTSGDLAVAGRRRLDPTTLSKRLRGDLDWIVMKALAKERDRRYGAASDLAADVERHLGQQPVSAGPPGLGYRLGKFLARNRTMVAAVTLVLAAMVAGLVGTGYGVLEAARQRDRAQQEAQQARQALAFLDGVVSLADPAVALQPDLSVRALLDRASTRIDDAFDGQPLAEARVRSTIGRAYASLGEHHLAEAHLRRSVALVDAAGVEDRGNLYATLWALTHVAFRLETADAYGIASRARREGLAHIAASAPDVAEALGAFHRALSDVAHRVDPAGMAATVPLFERSLAVANAQLASDDPLWPVVADTYMDTGYQLWYTEHEAFSEAYYEAAVAIRRRVLPAAHPDLARAVGQWVTVLNRAGKPEQATAAMRETVEAMTSLYEVGNFQRAHAESLLGETLVGQGAFAEAEPLLLGSHAVIAGVVDREDNFFVVDSYARLIALYEGWGRSSDAERYRRELATVAAHGVWGLPWALARHIFAADHRDLLTALEAVDEQVGGIAYAVAAGDARPPALASAVASVVANLGSVSAGDPRRVVVGRFLLAWANRVDPRVEHEARRMMANQAIMALEDDAPSLPHDLAEAYAQRAEVRAQTDDLAGARADADRVWQLTRPGARSDNWLGALAKARLARRLLAVGAVERAEALLRPTLEVLEADFGPDHRHVQDARAVLRDLERRPAPT